MTRLTTLLLLFCFFNAVADDDVRVGIIMDCPNSMGLNFLDRVLEDTRLVLRSDYNLIIDEEFVLHADCQESQIKKNLDALLANDQIDLIIGIDGLSSHTLAINGPYEKPVLALAVYNAKIQGIPITNDGRSGVKNLTYNELPYAPLRDLEVFHDMTNFSRLAIMMEEVTYQRIPTVAQFSEEELDRMNTSFEFVFVNEDIDGVLQQLQNRFDAVYFLPNERLSTDKMQQMIDGVNEMGLLSFSVMGRLDVDNGVLAGMAPKSNIEQISRRTALTIQRILGGEDPEDIDVKIRQNEELVINMATAREVGFSPSWETLAEAVLINEMRDDINRSVNLFSAIAEGLSQNLDIDIAKKDIDVQRSEVDIAKSGLLPDLNAAAALSRVDETTADISFGQNPQNRGIANAELNQMIYSEQVVANKKIQKILLQSTEASVSARILDIILDVSIGYLSLMQAKTSENIQKRNLDVIRKNLELAKVSSSLGQADPSDLFRWQGEIATAKAGLQDAKATRIQAEFSLNQILLREINEDFVTEDVDLEDVRFIINNDIISSYVSNPAQFYRYADFLVQRANQKIPDLLEIDYNIAAQERTVVLNQRNRYVPNVNLSGVYNYELYRRGAGSEPPPGFSIPNTWNWTLQVGAALPIYQGGRRVAQVQQSKIQLEQANTVRLNSERLVELQVRANLEKVRASFTNIRLTRDAETANLKNFQLMQDNYAQGLVSITQLLDAQNAAVFAAFDRANATYILLIDLLTLERSTGEYYMLMTDEEKAEYESELISFFNQ